MRVNYLLYFALIFLIGCAAYKELQPVPTISFIEAGYIELKDDGENFELSEGKKYFIKFPPPSQENTYLVLNYNEKPSLQTYLTRVFDDGEGQIIKIPDESLDPENISVYAIDKTVPSFFWIIEAVNKDLILDMQYRYIAAWRYRFETRHAEFERILTENIQQRNVIEAIGTSVAANEVDYSGEKRSLEQKTANLKQIQSTLFEIESIFPPDILNSQDASYLSYLEFKQNLNAEISFQEDYHNMLDLMGLIATPSLPMNEFTSHAAELSLFLGATEKYPANVLTEAKKLTGTHLDEIVPYYERELRKKKTIDTIDFNISEIEALYKSSDKSIPGEFQELANFITAFNKKSSGLMEIKKQVENIENKINKPGTWPGNTYFNDQRAALAEIRYKMPQAETKSFGKYKSYACASLLNKEIKATQSKISQLSAQLQRAEQLVPQINLYKNQGNYSGILRLLKQNSDIPFLLNKYADIDQLSLTQQTMAIKNAFRAHDWANAEQHLKTLHLDKNFLNPKQTLPKKTKIVSAYEDSLLNLIETISVNNANKFIESNKTNIDLVDSLYMNTALVPVYEPTFSSKSVADLNKRKSVLSKRMNFLKHQKFPQTSIEAIYRSFTSAIHDKGVEKARAIIIHGKNYQGDDKKIKNLIAECDPYAAKWLTKAKQYRKIYVLPTSTKIGGSNQYLMKVNIKIPSDAKFPVFDINVKLPMEIARHAGNQQWYKSMTFNGKILKNEGRFTITAPSADTNYEMQITPLQVNKTGNNVLEIKFDYDSFKVFEVSIMGQRPIMKKD